MRFLIIALMCFGYSTQALAWTVKGIGSDNCSVVLNDRTEHEFEYAQWILGYLSAKNHSLDANVGAGVNWRGIMGAGVKFCRENPLRDWADASENVYAQLRELQ